MYYGDEEEKEPEGWALVYEYLQMIPMVCLGILVGAFGFAGGLWFLYYIFWGAYH